MADGENKLPVEPEFCSGIRLLLRLYLKMVRLFCFEKERK